MRNVVRNRRRTGLSLGVIVIAVAVLHLALGFMSYLSEASQQNIAEEVGALQVAGVSYFAGTADGYDYLIGPAMLSRVRAIAEEFPQISSVTWKLSFAGLVGNLEDSTLLYATGVVPGSALDDSQGQHVSGTPLKDDGSAQLLVGTGVSALLGLQDGDVVSVATGTVRGRFNAASAQVTGTIEYFEQAKDERFGVMPLAMVQRLLNTDGVETIVLGLTDLRLAEQTAAQLQARLDEAGIPLVVRTWSQLFPAWQSYQAFFALFQGFTASVIVGLLFFSIFETLTMAFLERVREVGTIRAIGTLQGQVFGLFVGEGLLLGVTGGLLGVGLGLAGGGLVHLLGVEWVAPTTVEAQPLVISAGVFSIVVPGTLSVIAALIGSIYPAWRSANLTVVEALRRF